MYLLVPVPKLTKRHVLQETKLKFFVCNSDQFSHFFWFYISFILRGFKLVYLAN